MKIILPHGAERHQAEEQRVQQIIRHIWTKRRRSQLSGSRLLLTWPSFRPAERKKKKKIKKEKRQRDKRQQWYIKHYSQTLESTRQKGWVGGIDIIQIIQISVAVIHISLAVCERARRSAHPRPFASSEGSRQTEPGARRARWRHSSGLGLLHH